MIFYMTPNFLQAGKIIFYTPTVLKTDIKYKPYFPYF